MGCTEGSQRREKQGGEEGSMGGQARQLRRRSVEGITVSCMRTATESPLGRSCTSLGGVVTRTDMEPVTLIDMGCSVRSPGRAA